MSNVKLSETPQKESSKLSAGEQADQDCKSQNPKQPVNCSIESIETLHKYGDFKEKRDSDTIVRKEIAHSYVSNLLDF